MGSYVATINILRNEGTNCNNVMIFAMSRTLLIATYAMPSDVPVSHNRVFNIYCLLCSRCPMAYGYDTI